MQLAPVSNYVGLNFFCVFHNKDPSITGILGAIPMEIRRHSELAELLLDRQNVTLQLLANAFAAAQQRGEITDKASPEDQVIAIMGAAVGITLLNSGLGNSNVMDSMQVFIDLIEARFFQ